MFNPIVKVEHLREPVNELEKDNPFKLNMPPPLDDSKEKQKEILTLFEDKTEFPNEYKKLPKTARRNLLTRIHRTGFIPLPWHKELSDIIDALLFTSYDCYNPFDVETANLRHFIVDQEAAVTLPASGAGAVLIGYSGVGKTTAVFQKIKPLCKTFEFTEFNGKPFEAYQIPVLYVLCPVSGSIKDLVDEILLRFYEATGMGEYNRKVKRSRDVMEYMKALM